MTLVPTTAALVAVTDLINGAYLISLWRPKLVRLFVEVTDPLRFGWYFTAVVFALSPALPNVLKAIGL